MKERLKILHLEDLSADAMLVEREIKKAGLQFDMLVVSNKKEFLKGLAEFSADIVLSDHSLPDMDSHEALRLTKLLERPVPFILITATVSEEYAVEIMKQGASDYILKDRLQRLPTAIQNAIEKWNMENERQKYLEQTIASEERYRQMIETAQEGIWMVDEQFRTTFVNRKMCEILEYTPDEMIGRVNIEFMDEPSTALLQNTRKRKKQGIGENYDLVLITKSGKQIWARLSTSSIIDSKGKFKGSLAMVTDITNKKIAEEKLRHERSLLRTLIDNLPDYIFVKDARNRHLISNKASVGLFGFRTEKEIIGKQIGDLISDPRIKGYIRDDQEILSSGKPVINKEECITDKDGVQHWLLTTKIPLKNETGITTGLVGISRDITDRKVIEEVLHQFNERYELLSRATNDAIWDWDLKLGFVTWNHGLQTIFGYPEKDLENSYDWWREKIHPEDYGEVQRSIDRTFEGKYKNWSGTYRFRAADGTFKYVYDRAYIIYDDERKPLRMTGAMQDISERMKAIEDIEKLSLVASKTDNAVMITDAEQNIEWVNDSFVRMMDYTLEEIKGHKPDFRYGPETDVAMITWMNARLKQGESFSGELLNYSKTGRKYWLKLEVTPVFSEEGQLKNLIWIHADITQQKEFESRITAIARELSSLIENANVPIFGIDRNGYINEWNKVSADLSGIPKSELLGRRWIDELVGPEHRQAAEQMIAHVLHGNPVGNFELPVLTKSKKRLVLLLSASPRTDTEKAINGAIIVAQDITELIEYRRNLEKIVQDRTRELNEALQKEKELVNIKSKFVSIASHEFRTPLSTITLATGFLKKFKEKIKTEEIDAKLTNIEKQVSHMTHLLDDVLTVGKAEAGKITVRLVKINILEFFERLSGEIEQSTDRTHKVRLTHYLQVPTILSDEKLLRNIVINTLTNAIKFSPGERYVDLTLWSDADKLSFQVRDYGIGIPPDDMKQLFEPFHRGSNVNSIQGTGLGLSIIKKAVDLFHGFIDVKSDVEKGTEFNITLPVLHE